MLRQTVTVTTVEGKAREIELREMTFGEVRRIREEGEKLPFTWPVETQVPAEALHDLPGSEVKRLAQVVYDLTYGTAKSEKNS